MNRYTFVIQVHPGEISTLENVSTQERIALDGLDEVGPRVERWLAELADAQRAAAPPLER